MHCQDFNRKSQTLRQLLRLALETDMDSLNCNRRIIQRQSVWDGQPSGHAVAPPSLALSATELQLLPLCLMLNHATIFAPTSTPTTSFPSPLDYPSRFSLVVACLSACAPCSIKSSSWAWMSSSGQVLQRVHIGRQQKNNSNSSSNCWGESKNYTCSSRSSSNCSRASNFFAKRQRQKCWRLWSWSCRCHWSWSWSCCCCC